MRYVLYTLIVTLLLPFAFLHLLWRARRQPEYLRHWPERLGWFPRSRDARPLIWLHTVSVGETRASAPLVAALKTRYPHHRLLLTHMTPTGRATAQALFGDSVERRYLPYDTPWGMLGFLSTYQPALGLIIETELWPNLIKIADDAGFPVLLVNARMSAKSARGYRLWRGLTRRTLRRLAAISAIGAEDAQRLTDLGARAVATHGNLKFDIAPPPELLQLGAHWRHALGARRVLLCASTREGEEALILAAWQRAQQTQPVDALLIIAPRHPQRFAEVAALIGAQGFSLRRRSLGETADAATQVWLADSMGELFAWYALADVALIGGSLLDYGSQNLIEAAAVGVPILLGPSTYNFRDAARDALACGAARQVVDAAAAIAEAQHLLTEDAVRQAMSAAARQFAVAHQGATARTLALIERYLPAH